MPFSLKLSLLLLTTLGCKAQTFEFTDEKKKELIEIIVRNIRYVDSLELKRKEAESHKEQLEVNANGEIIFVPDTKPEADKRDALKITPTPKQRKGCDGNASEIKKARESLPTKFRE